MSPKTQSNLLFIIPALCVAALLPLSCGEAEAAPAWVACKKHQNVTRNRKCVIRSVFGSQGDKAVRVAHCESRFDPKARNGQYRGVFQMGSSERKQFGHGRTVLAQSFAARKYYRISGWSPWACA